MATPALTDSLEPAAKRAKPGPVGEADAGPSDAPAGFRLPRVTSATTKGRKHANEDVTLITDDLAPSRSFYAILDGHGGRECADWVAERLPALLREHLSGVRESAAVKEALKAAFAACDAELLAVCAARDWSSGTCCAGLLVDGSVSPPRCYVANVGDSRAFCVVERDGGVRAAVSLTKDHSPLDAKERRRIEAAGGRVVDGRVGGSLGVSRSLGDARLKKAGLIATPDVTSFNVGHAQRAVVLGCDGVWRVFAGQQLVDFVEDRLPKMEALRARLSQQLDGGGAAALTREERAALAKQREAASEEGVLRELLHEAVHTRNAKDNVTVVMVRFA